MKFISKARICTEGLIFGSDWVRPANTYIRRMYPRSNMEEALHWYSAVIHITEMIDRKFYPYHERLSK